MRIRRAKERGRTRLDWLDSRHTFSFADYYDPEHMGFRTLRVINDDVVAPGRGFPTHPHRDMEIVTWVYEGALRHEDSTGTGSVIRPGEIQRMSAGTGVRHSEWNGSDTEAVRLLQIWILPERAGLEPGYEQKAFDDEALAKGPTLVASPDGRAGSVTIHQDAAILAARPAAGDEIVHRPAEGRHLWVQVAKGTFEIAGDVLRDGDGAAFSDGGELRLRCTAPGELLLFELP